MRGELTKAVEAARSWIYTTLLQAVTKQPNQIKFDSPVCGFISLEKESFGRNDFFISFYPENSTESVSSAELNIEQLAEITDTVVSLITNKKLNYQEEKIIKPIDETKKNVTRSLRIANLQFDFFQNETDKNLLESILKFSDGSFIKLYQNNQNPSEYQVSSSYYENKGVQTLVNLTKPKLALLILNGKFKEKTISPE